jgi:hypothetical protein
LIDLLLSPNAGDYVDVDIHQWLMKATLDAIGFGEHPKSTTPHLLRLTSHPLSSATPKLRSIMTLELSMRDRTTWLTLSERQRASPFPLRI